MSGTSSLGSSHGLPAMPPANGFRSVSNRSAALEALSFGDADIEHLLSVRDQAVAFVFGQTERVIVAAQDHLARGEQFQRCGIELLLAPRFQQRIGAKPL